MINWPNVHVEDIPIRAVLLDSTHWQKFSARKHFLFFHLVLCTVSLSPSCIVLRCLRKNTQHNKFLLPSWPHLPILSSWGFVLFPKKKIKLLGCCFDTGGDPVPITKAEGESGQNGTSQEWVKNGNCIGSSKQCQKDQGVLLHLFGFHRMEDVFFLTDVDSTLFLSC